MYEVFGKIMGIYFGENEKFAMTEPYTVDSETAMYIAAMPDKSAFLNILAANYNMCLEDFAVFDNRSDAESFVETRNKDLEEGRLKVSKCKDCGCFLLLYGDKTTKQCAACRKKKEN